MKATEAFHDLFSAVSAIVAPGDGARVMRRLTALAGAEHYLLLDVPPAHAAERPRIVASDWPYDTIEIIGPETISRLADATGVVGLGAFPSQFSLMNDAALQPLLGVEQATLLAEFGHHELIAMRIHAGMSRGLLIFSTSGEQTVDLDMLPQAQLLCCHVWSKLNRGAPRGLLEDPLSERERECLRWVSEGKTTDEVAVILDVSANTVTRYILHATQKLSAANRTMAITIAIRNGII